MDPQKIVNVLNELLALEQVSLAPRLVQSTMFVSRLSVEDSHVVQNMARASEEHGAWLADAILQLGGVPGPRIADAQWANLHYQDVRNVLPRLLGDLEALIQKYALAAHYVTDEPRAAELLTRIRDRHRQELSTLRPLVGQQL
jgi:bacterioferritin (cytochrome b1)